MEKSCLPEKAFMLFQQTEIDYNNTLSISAETLQKLGFYFGESLQLAAILVDKCKVIEYSLPDFSRKVYKLHMSKENHTIFEHVNYCQCEVFKSKVLDSMESLTCQHVLAVRLAKIMGKTEPEILREEMFEQMLNEQLYSFMDIDTQSLFLQL